MSDARIGYDASFSLHNGADPGALVELGEVTAIDPGAEEAGTTEVTHFKSPGRRREHIKTLIDGGTGSITLNWVPGSATDILLTAAVTDPNARAYTWSVPTESDGTWEVSGTVNVLSRTPAIPLDDRMTCTVTLQFTGERIEAAGV